MSTNPVSHGSVRAQRIRPSSCLPSGSHRGRPKRVSSKPNTRTGSGSTSSTAPRATTARCTVGHDTRCAAATSDWSRPSSTATASAARSRVVVRIPAGTWATCSVNVCRAHAAVRHRQRRLRHCTCANSPSTRQVPWTGQHPVLTRRRHRPACRAARRVRIIGDQLHDLHPDPGQHDTLHRQPGQPQQARRIIATVNHGPWLSSRCSRTQRGSRSRGPPSFRRAGRVQPQVARSRSKNHIAPQDGIHSRRSNRRWTAARDPVATAGRPRSVSRSAVFAPGPTASTPAGQAAGRGRVRAVAEQAPRNHRGFH